MAQEEASNKEAGNRPAARIQIGNVHGAVWRNDHDGKTFYSATFEVRYKDAAGNWQSGQSYGPGDLLALMKAADRAHDAILELRQKSRQDQDGD